MKPDEFLGGGGFEVESQPAEDFTGGNSFTVDQSMAGLANSQSTLERMQAESAQATAEADALSSAGNIAKETAKGTLGTIADTGLKFLGSALNAPTDIFNQLRGKPVNTEAKIAGFGGPQQTIQGQFASETLPAVEQGTMSPLMGTAKTVGQTALGAADAFGAKGLTTGIKSIAKKPLGAIKGALKSYSEKRAAAKETKNVTEALTPHLLPTKVEKVGKLGKLTEVSPWSPSKKIGLNVEKDPTTIGAVQAVKNVANALGKKSTDIVNTGVGSATKNSNNLYANIREYSQKVVSPMLKENPTPFNFEDLRKSLEIVKPTKALDNPEAMSTYNRVRERLLESAANAIRKTGNVNPEDDFNDIWNARKTIDSIIDDELGAKTLLEPARNGVQAAAKDFRGAFKEFLSDSYRYSGQMENLNRYKESVKTLEQKFGRKLNEEEIGGLKANFGLVSNPKMEELANLWDSHMSNMSSLYDALSVTANKARKESGKNWYQLFAKEHPTLTKAVQIGAGGAGAGATFQVGQSAVGN